MHDPLQTPNHGLGRWVLFVIIEYSLCLAKTTVQIYMATVCASTTAGSRSELKLHSLPWNAGKEYIRVY